MTPGGSGVTRRFRIRYGSVKERRNRGAGPCGHKIRDYAAIVTSIQPPAPQPHRHRRTRLRVVVQLHGVPYEYERTVCSECSQVLSERPLRRAAA